MTVAVEELPHLERAGDVTPTRGLRRRSWRWLAWLLAAVAVIVAAWRFSQARRAAPIPVATVRVQRGSVRDFVTSVAAGRVTAKTEATLRAEVAGRVQAVHHRRGARVAKDEPLISYDAAELRERVRSAEAAVALARAQSLQANANAELAASSAARNRQLYKSAALSEAELETSEAKARALARAADAARASLSQAAANAELASTGLRKAVVRAPFDGTVLSTAIEVGETAVLGAPLLALADTSQLHVQADVDEADVGRVALGMTADVALDAFPKERLRGTLSFVAPSVNRDAHGGRSVALEIALPPDPRLMVGMSADVDVIVAVHERVLWIPPNAVIGRGAERSVFLVRDGVAHKRAIDVSIATWEAVEIDSGLAEGDEIVAALSTPQLADGVRVEPRPAVSSGAER
jgi:HlyD family secretion protein